MAGRKKPIAEENPLFKWILIIDFTLMLVMVGLMLFAVCMESSPATDLQKGLFDFGRNVGTGLAGTFAGLAGAKAGRAAFIADGFSQAAAPVKHIGENAP